MSKGIRYSTEFKQEAVNQVKIHSYSTAEVADRLGVSTKAIYRWIKELSKPVEIRAEESDLRAEIARLKRELKRTEQERNILKEAAVDSSGQCNSLTILLICMGTSDETSKAHIHTR